LPELGEQNPLQQSDAPLKSGTAGRENDERKPVLQMLFLGPSYNQDDERND
jgi:hypothetical protein